MAGTRSNVLLVGTAPGQARLVRETLLSATGGPYAITHATRLADALPLLGHGVFDVVLLDMPLDDAAPAEAVAQVARSAPATAIVALLRPGDTAEPPRGVHASLLKEPLWELDSGLLTRALETARNQVPERRVAAPRPPDPRGTILSFVGAGGGSGTTSAMLYTAHELAARGSRTIAVELRNWPGTLAALAGVTAAGHLGQVLDLPKGQLTIHDVERALTPVTAHLKLLLAPAADRGDDALDAEKTSRVLNVLRRMADHVLIELPCEVSPAMEVVCAASVLVAVVASTEPAELWRGRRVVKHLQGWTGSRGEVSAVVLQRGRGAALVPQSLVAELGCQVLAMVPELSATPTRDELSPFFSAVADRAEASARARHAGSGAGTAPTHP